MLSLDSSEYGSVVAESGVMDFLVRSCPSSLQMILELSPSL
ncbi:MAG TPA: hypothetical protein VIH22_09400 [Cyclobacteriaceae bacterium]